ncbi:MAG: hypothetical protein HQ521_07680 [Bacteroidetes bacterium]|nr:hypothetical protein [Bacteroidota bacterium]
MKYVIVLNFILLTFLLAGCGSGKQLTQKKSEAESFFLANNYSDALIFYKEIINTYDENNNSDECKVYTKAGESALKTGDAKLAITYLKKATNTKFANQSTYYYLAQAYKEVDNLSLEIVTLVEYLELFPQGNKLIDVNTRLFYTYVESDNYEGALQLWPEIISNDQKNISLLEAYFSINNGLNNIDECNKTAQELLNINDENIVALSWFGKQYYRKAEDLYQKEMKAYENKKTNKQYNILLVALDNVTYDFKKSLKYFTKIYSLQPTPENANYLSHIYGRLSDEKKSEYYKKLAN